MLTSADFVVIAIYSVLMTWIGVVASRKSAGVEEYFAAGHQLPWWMAAVSHHVSGYSAVVFVGYTGLAASAGFSIWTLFSLSVFLAMMVTVVVWAPRWSRLRVITPVEYLERRYSNSVRLTVGLSGITIKFLDLGIKLYAISLVVQICSGWPLLPIILGAGALTVAYVLVGGLWATVLTDLTQFVIQLLLSVLVLILVLSQVGGWGSMWDRLPENRAALFNPDAGIDPWFWLVLLVVTAISYSGGTWGLAQRFISVGRPRDTQKAALLSGFLYLVYPLVIFIPAWAAPLILTSQFDPNTLLPNPGFDPDQTYILLAREALSGVGPGLIGLLICSMFAATMSMIDSDLNSLAAVFTRDIYQRNLNPGASERVLLRTGKLATVFFGLAILVMAVWVAQSEGMGKVFEKTVKLFAAIFPPVALPLMLGLIWKRTTARGALFSMLGGFAAFAVLKALYPDDFVIYTGGELLVAGIIFFGDGWINTRSPEKEREVEALFAQLEGKDINQDSQSPPANSDDAVSEETAF